MSTKNANDVHATKNTSTRRRSSRAMASPKKNAAGTLRKEREQALREKCATIRKIELRATANECEARYLIGQELLPVQEDENGKANATYGTGAIAKIAKHLGRDANTLYEYAKVAATWSKEEFDGLAVQKNEGGVPLSFSHFIVLAGAAKDERRRLFDVARAQSLSVRDLKARLSSPSTAGAPLKRLRDYVGRVEKCVANWCARGEVLDKADYVELDDTIRSCQDATKNLEALAAALRERRDRLPRPTISKAQDPGRPGTPTAAAG